MLGKEGMEDLLDSPGMDNFFLLPSGLRAPNPSELVGSQGFAAFLAAARERYDHVILDSTPVLAVADASIIAAQADGILCVVRVGSVPRAALRRAKGILAAAKTEFLGVCLNGVKAEVSPDFHELAYYKYRYGPPKPPTRVRPALAALVSHPAVTPQHIAAGVVGLLALTGGVWALGRLAAPAPTPVQSPRPAPRPAKRATPAPAPVRRETSAPVIQVRRELYSVAVPSGNGGQVLIGQFETEDEAASFGAALLGEGITSSYRVVPAEP
jgi:hypothetical protein